MSRRPRRSTLFPYPTLFRPQDEERHEYGQGDAQARHDAQHARCRADEREEALRHLDRSAHAIGPGPLQAVVEDRKSTRLNSSHANISYAVFCLKKKKKTAVT